MLRFLFVLAAIQTHTHVLQCARNKHCVRALGNENIEQGTFPRCFMNASFDNERFFGAELHLTSVNLDTYFSESSYYFPKCGPRCGLRFLFVPAAILAPHALQGERRQTSPPGAGTPLTQSKLRFLYFDTSMPRCRSGPLRRRSRCSLPDSRFTVHEIAQFRHIIPSCGCEKFEKKNSEILGTCSPQFQDSF